MSMGKSTCLLVKDSRWFLARMLLCYQLQGMGMSPLNLLARRKIDWLFISTHGRRHPACRDILVEADYRILAEHGVGGSASADGLLVAQSPRLDEIPPIEISEVEGLVTAHG